MSSFGASGCCARICTYTAHCHYGIIQEMNYGALSFIQRGMWFPVKLFLTLWAPMRVRGKEHLRAATPPLIIIANHKTVLDHFVIGALLSFRSCLLPLRFLGETQHFQFWWLNMLRTLGVIRIFYWLFGVSPVVRRHGLKQALAHPLRLLQEGGTVVIYPEGSVVRADQVGMFKRGIGALEHWSRVPILPVAIRTEKKRGHLRRVYYVNIGRQFFIPKELSFEDSADYARRIVKMLYVEAAAEK